MISFVNAKINIGLQIVRRRPDGYHDLQTVFYPVGCKAGSPSNPVPFPDILELSGRAGFSPSSDICQPGNAGFSLPPSFSFSSDSPYPPESNLVCKAAALFYEAFPQTPPVHIRLEKHIPDGAGIGGGSADAAFTLSMLNDFSGGLATEPQLAEMALRLGADCPFFLFNRPAYAEGVGERLTELSLDLSGKWLLLVRPDIRVSTREAFAGVVPKHAAFDLRQLPALAIERWRDCVHNDFEDSIFPQFPALAEIKRELYASGALYASLTGSGSCLYGIYCDRGALDKALQALRISESETLYPLQL